MSMSFYYYPISVSCLLTICTCFCLFNSDMKRSNELCLPYLLRFRSVQLCLVFGMVEELHPFQSTRLKNGKDKSAHPSVTI